MGETHLLVEHHWRTHFAQCHARVGGELTVKQLRQWMDLPQPMGLPIEVQNLIILTYAAQTNRRFFRLGGPLEPSIESVPDDLELREQTLPAVEHWQTSVARAGKLFGLVIPEILNAANVGKLVDEVRGKVQAKRDSIGSLVTILDTRVALYPSADGKQDRLITARSAQALLAALQHAEESQFVQVLATATLATSESAMGQTLARASQLNDVLRLAAWNLFEAMRNLTDHRRAAAQNIFAKLGEALAADEHVVSLQNGFDALSNEALSLLTVTVPTPRTPTDPLPEPPAAVTPAGQSVAVLVEQSEVADLTAERASEVLDGLRSRMQKEPGLRLSLSWRLSKDGGNS
jgi:hypothetical protein